MRLLLPLILAACGVVSDGGPVITGAQVTAMDAFTLQHTPVAVDREVVLTGAGFLGTSQGPWVSFGDVESPSVRIRDEHTVVALVPVDVHGPVTVTLTNPDRQTAELTVDLR